ncbi:MAG: lycopene cyclase family protein [Persicimonas sp.]
MDVIVVGAGPAGLAASAALSRRGLSVISLAPEHPSPWPNSYGLWEDELEGLGFEDCYECRWKTPVVYTAGGARTELDRVYLRLDNDKLRTRLLDRCEQNDVRFVEGFAEAIGHDETGATLIDREGGEHRARLVIEATGHRPKFVEREAGSVSASQVAYGFVGEFDGSPIRHDDGHDELVLMDFRQDYAGEKLRESPAPSFLYAMELGDDRYFVEETSLAHRPALSFDILEDRLAGRLRSRGAPVMSVEEVERCLIPMDSPMPRLDQRVVGFGAAASMVHPATGYQMGAMLRTAPKLAEAVADLIGADGIKLIDISRQAWRAIWPEDKIRARKLWLLGLESLLDLDARQTSDFFEVFFSLPDAQWQGYMSGTLGPHELARVMWSLFSHMPISLQVALGKTALGREGWEVLKALRG